MNEARMYEQTLDKIYVDFYKMDATFDMTFNKALNDEYSNNAYDKILKDVIELDLSKVSKLADLL
ncbi:MAG: hypothetical protein MJ245_06120 [Clostridia bacterium]|nr:hypothetical protein [Clostridia bacterium]